MIRRLYARWKFNRLTRRFDKQIAKARKNHAKVKYLQKQKTDFVHACLRGDA
jgi:hypothetical protein